MGKINILFCIEYLAQGGTEKQLMALIGGLDKKRFEPHLCCLRYSAIGVSRRSDAAELFAQVSCKKIRLDFTSFASPTSLFNILKLILFIKRNNIQIIQSFFQDPAIVGVLAGKVCGVKHIVASFRDMAFWCQGETDRKMKLIYHQCTQYIANSKAVRDKYVEIFNLPMEKFKVVYNGVDNLRLDKFLGKEKQNSEQLLVGIIANLNRKVKRVDVFLKAAAIVLKRSNSFRFIVIGDGELKNDLYDLSKELGILNYVYFAGRTDDIDRWLTDIDIGVNSSDSEGLSNSVLEFMTSGIPVVATDVGGNAEVVVDGASGYLVPVGDYRKLAEKIMQLSTDKDRFKQMQKQSVAIVNNKFTMRAYYREYEKFYEELFLS